mgnify:CR=1 FL=1
MPEKVKMAKVAMQVLGWIYILMGSLFGIIWMVVGIAAMASGENEAMGVGIGFGCGGFLAIIFGIVFAIITFKAAKAFAEERKAWGRTWGIIVGILSITAIVGIFILIGLFSDEASQWATS